MAGAIIPDTDAICRLVDRPVLSIGVDRIHPDIFFENTLLGCSGDKGFHPSGWSRW
jgi:hypothetical protein